MEKGKLLVVEDDKRFGACLKKRLEKNAYKVFLLVSVQEEAAVLKSENIDLILLGVDITVEKGLELCKRIRKEHFIPIIFMGCGSDSDMQIRTLNCGGDDYVDRSIDFKVLLARIRSHIRRYRVYKGGGPDRKDLVFRRFKIDPSRHMVWKIGEDGVRQDRLHLSPIEYKLLEMFIANAGTLLTYREIYHTIWKTDYLGDVRTVMVHVSNLRKKINYLDSDMIRTVRGTGYVFLDK
ncbi:MAG: response regulator transcription factor [Dorea sp.]|nr:response regulator transcription factor [Dorea sp.]